MSAEPQLAGFQRRCAMVSLMAATTMMSMDQTIANVALPNIQGSLSASQEQVSWVLTSYIVASAITIPMLGWLCARWGRKRVILLSIAGFTLTSIACGMATTIDQIVVFRALQGISGAGLMPLSQASILDLYPASEHKRVMNVWSIGAILGPIMGPVLGARITDGIDWRWVFFINLPIGVVTFLGISAFAPETRINRNQRLDLFGFISLGVCIGAFQLMLDRGETKDWFSSTEIAAEAVIAGLALYLFFIHSFTTKDPFINPALLRNRNFVFSTFVGILQMTIFLSVMSLQPSFFQNLLGYPVMLSGMMMAPRGLGMLIGTLLSGRVHRIDFRVVIIVGFLLSGLGVWQMANFTLGVDLWPIFLTGFTQGLGTGISFGVLTAVAFSTLPPQLRTEGAGIYLLVRMCGASIGIAVTQSSFMENQQVLHSYLAEQVRPDNPLARVPFLPLHLDFSTHGLVGFDSELGRQAAMLAYNIDFRVIGAAALIAIPLILMLQKPPAMKAPVPAE